MTGWTVYNRPSDYPEHYVARRWVVINGKVVPTSDMFTADTLDELRALIPPGLFRMPRMDGDEPQIVEVWI